MRHLFEPLSRDPRAGVVTAIVATTVLVSVLAPFQEEIGLLNEGLVLLLLTLAVSATWGWKVGLFTAVLTNLTLNFFFVPPLHTFNVQAPSNIFGLAVFLVVSILGGSLLSRARGAAEVAQRRQAETQILLQLSRDLIGRTDPGDALNAFCENVIEALGAPGAAVLSKIGGQWSLLASSGSSDAARGIDTGERVMADRAFESGQASARGYTGLGSTRRRRIVVLGGSARVSEMAAGVAFVPLKIGDRQLGVLRLDGPVENRIFRGHPEEILAAFAREAALGVQRVELARAVAHTDAMREADEMKTALMTSISHDLKTPLAGIKASVSSLLDRSVTWTEEDRDSFLETIDSQSDRLNRVISDILDLNRIESGVVKAALSYVHARDLLEEAAERTRISTAGRTIGLVAPNDLVVRADPSLIVQALVNLIENAAKYSSDEGAIRLSAAGSAGEAELIVADEGPGIAPQDLPYVFDRFYRAADQSRRVKGSGLGLAIVKGFVSLSEGSVRVESSAKGTRFIVALPAATGEVVA